MISIKNNSIPTILKNTIKHFSFILLLTFSTITAIAIPHKREFRGAWIQCVNGQFQGLPTEKIQKTLIYQLNELQKDGVNAIIFQVRPECDALYNSPFEPWSRYLTGKQGVPPSPYWDPLQWMIEECHRRGMELHAWINPYRAKTKGTNKLAYNHIAIKSPEHVFTYDGQYILNPGIPSNRDYICKIVNDIVTRYDIDGLHIDDYFYPYPVKGLKFPDWREYQQFGKGFANIGDWRRNNVNLFIKQLSNTIHTSKPWVKFGVSPFGIYRNARTASNGSKTRGLQNYDDLYADVIKWINEGWVDYCVPQIYWQIGHPTADYKELVKWWNNYAGNRPLYIGEDIERTVKYADPKNPLSHQQPAKWLLKDQAKNVKGTVLWYAKMAVDNPGNYGLKLRYDYWHTPALQPLMPFIDNKAPRKPKKIKITHIDNEYYISWKAPKGKEWKDKANKYVIYCFDKNETINLEDPSHILAITYNTTYKLPTLKGNPKKVIIITALDRMENESIGKKKKITLRY